MVFISFEEFEALTRPQRVSMTMKGYHRRQRPDSNILTEQNEEEKRLIREARAPKPKNVRFVNIERGR